jgi:diguanylate cyclase (GGDEF)-like protein/PAS domain S-box-containing protein
MLVIYRIDQPLLNLKVAMHDLSNGDMSRRLETDDAVEDEFSELSVNFNRFAERTQLLIDEVSNSKYALEQSDKKTRAILENALVGIANVQGKKIISVNRKFEEIFGFERHEILDMKADILYPSNDDYEAIGKAAYSLLANGEIYQGERQLKRKDGALFWCAMSAKSIIDNQPEEGIIWLYEDITQRKENEKELRLLANYDTLTGLPNRSLFHDRLGQVLERARRYKNNSALMFIDLDRFKTINDSFGHTAGDELLREVAKRLLSCVRGSDTVSRLGGDEFTIIIPDVETTIAISKVAGKIIQIMAKPVMLQGQEVIITPSIGISLFPDDADDFATLLQNADAAMYHAKSEGRNNYQFYTQKMNAEAREQLVMESRLRNAIGAEDFRLHYHPQVDVASRKIIGYEALIRWYENGDGEKIIYPGAFISVLEDTGMIVEVGEWVLRTACIEAMQMIANNKALEHISVNLSARQFVDEGLANRVGTILEETGLPPEFLVLEITETVLMEEAHQSLNTLNELSALGIKLSLDDFGTGYSSLAYLKRFPIDIIKIDQSFVRDINTDESDAAICEAIMAIAQRLDLNVVAEGVETESQFDFLSESQCQAIQGNLFGEPEPLENIINITKKK